MADQNPAPTRLSIPQVGMWTWDVPANRVFGDAFIAEYFNMNVEEARSGPPVERYLAAVHRDDIERLTAEIEATLVGGADLQTQYRVNTRSLGERRVISIGQCYLDDGGRPIHYPGFIADVSERVMNTGSGGTTIESHLVAAREAAILGGRRTVAYLTSAALLELRANAEDQAMRWHSH